MSLTLDIFGLETTSARPTPYTRVGFPSNPFRADAGESRLETFYPGHIGESLQSIQSWVADVVNGQTRQPLSLVGNIGSGKTRLLRFLHQRLGQQPQDDRIHSHLALLSDGGYSRGSVGGLLIRALEGMPWRSPAVASAEVLPLVWDIVNSSTVVPSGAGVLGKALAEVQRWPETERLTGAEYVSRWLRRSPLTEAQKRKVGLSRTIEWEGELPREVVQLIAVAGAVGVLGTFFLLIDQLEDLFRPTFSEIRRSRILTDLRGLVDDIDAGAPIGLMLSWSLEYGIPRPGTYVPADHVGEVEERLRREYEALHSRMQRRRVNLPLLSREHAGPFALKWIDACPRETGWDAAKQPSAEELAAAAWKQMTDRRILYPGGGGLATPRDFLATLAEEVDRRVGL